MPVFICEACNETLKRAKVEAHAATCRNCWWLSCMDCNKRFGGNDYWDHTSCVTEAERYQGATYVPSVNKGEVKQQAWLEKVQAKLEASDGAANLKPYMTRLLAFDNVPRKRAKFVNFAKNSLNLKADRDGIAEKLWTVVGAIEEAEKTVAPAPAPAHPVTPMAAKQPRDCPGSLMPSLPSAGGGLSTGGSTAASGPAATVPSAAPSATDERKAAAKKAKAAAKAAAAKAAAAAEEEAAADEMEAAAAANAARKAAKRAAKEEAAAPAVAVSSSSGAGSSLGKRKEREGGETAAIDHVSENAAKLESLKHQKGAVKWKKIIQKELKSVGGRMSAKELRKACVAEARAHPSYGGRDSKQLKAEFDELLPTFDKFERIGGTVTLR